MEVANEMKNKIIEFTRNYYRYALDKDGFGIERYVDYRDEFPKDKIQEILDADNPQDAFWEVIDEWDVNCDDWYYENDFWKQFKNFCNENGISDKENPDDIVREKFYWHYPDSFLNPTFKAVIRINTGDGDYERLYKNITLQSEEDWSLWDYEYNPDTDKFVPTHKLEVA